jgi:hypothetical protein
MKSIIFFVLIPYLAMASFDLIALKSMPSTDQDRFCHKLDNDQSIGKPFLWMVTPGVMTGCSLRGGLWS